MGTKDNILLLSAAFDNIEDPIQAAEIALAGDEGPNVVAVDLRGFVDNPDPL